MPDNGRCLMAAYYAGQWTLLDGGYWVCTECGKEIGECDCETCNCVPIDLNWGAMVFLMLLAVGYGVRAKMREKCTMKENENRA